MKQLEKVIRQLNILQSENEIKAALDKFQQYMEGILQWNEKVNLTAITDVQEFVKKHYMDSVSCVNAPEFKKAETIIDVGTGGGFPGVPLAILCPDKHFVLMDSLNKRIKIITQLCQNIGIDNVEAVHGRAEELAGKKSSYRESFDLCVSRAVANMSTLSEYCLPFVKTGGSMVSYKGPDSDEEIKTAEKAIKILGGKIDRIEEVNLEGLDADHRLVFVKKIKSTPLSYPRKAGTPGKEPIR